MKTIRLKLLALMSVIGIALPIASQAYDFSFNGLHYSIISEDNRTVMVTWESEDYQFNRYYVEGHVSIPQKVIYNSKSYSVTMINHAAFEGCSGLTSVDIPSSVTWIGPSAFHSCTGLKSVDIPGSVTRIGSGAFWRCTGLTSVDIPSSVTDIHYSAFSRCDKLSIINVQQDNPNYISMDGVLYSKKEGVVTSVVKCPEGKKGIIKIPSSVTTIGNRAFECCSGLTSVDIPSSVTTIEYVAFEGCSGLTSVDIPSSVTTIGSNAFRCSELETIFCHWEKPIEFDSNIFMDKNIMSTILYVPIGTKTEYEKMDPWRNFWNIEEIDYESFSGIKDVVCSDESTLEETDRFDISGKHVSKDYKGLVIIRYSDGSIKKQIVK